VLLLNVEVFGFEDWRYKKMCFDEREVWENEKRSGFYRSAEEGG
jgi:hypothetical protein